VVLAGALAVPAVALADAGDAGLAPVDPSSPSAHGISAIYWFILVFAALIWLVVTIPLVLFAVRYRNRSGRRDVDGPQVHGSTRLELAWTAGPVVILVLIVSFTFYKLGVIDDPAGAQATPGQIEVQGRQFYWQYVYPNGAITVNELRLPVDRVANLRITAPEGDVIHSFWVPQLNGKRDAIPGHPNTLKLKPSHIGTYPVRCAELCGLQHAKMNGTVKVLAAAEFDSWVAARAAAQQTEAGRLALGKEIFEGACATCHGLHGEGFIGPKLAGNSQVANADTVDRVVHEGFNTMPNVGEGWSDAELKALEEYLAKVVAKQGGGSGG
jgi:cytochrome c oxidase subunit II